MKKPHLIITPLEHEFISIYHVSPEVLFEHRCQEINPKQAAQEINKKMEIAWKRMQTIDRGKYEMYVNGFKPLKEDTTPFSTT